ncbi:hypothetical protein CPB85DRAFT_1562262 [Mucidula mucida]|nr:hypothetical protein CPB85DRAFT_1562262 [Mucidula mucida]
MLLADSPVGLLVSRNDYPWTDDEPRLCHEECLTDYTLILARTILVRWLETYQSSDCWALSRNHPLPDGHLYLPGDLAVCPISCCTTNGNLVSSINALIKGPDHSMPAH